MGIQFKDIDNQYKNLTNLYSKDTHIRAVYDSNNNMIWGSLLPTYVFLNMNDNNVQTSSSGTPTIWNNISTSSGQQGTEGGGSGNEGGGSGQSGSGTGSGETTGGGGQQGSQSGSTSGNQQGESGGSGSTSGSSSSISLITYNTPYYFTKYSFQYNQTPKLEKNINLLPDLNDTTFWTYGEMLDSDGEISESTPSYGGFYSDFVPIDGNKWYFVYVQNVLTNYPSNNNIILYNNNKQRVYIPYYNGDLYPRVDNSNFISMSKPLIIKEGWKHYIKYIRFSFDTPPKNLRFFQISSDKELSLLNDGEDNKAINSSGNIITENNSKLFTFNNLQKNTDYLFIGLLKNYNDTIKLYSRLYNQTTDAYSFFLYQNGMSNLFFYKKFNTGSYSTLQFSLSNLINNMPESYNIAIMNLDKGKRPYGYTIPIKVKPYGISATNYNCYIPSVCSMWDSIKYSVPQSKINIIQGDIPTEYGYRNERWNVEYNEPNNFKINGCTNFYTYDYPYQHLIYITPKTSMTIPISKMCITIHNPPKIYDNDAYIQVCFRNANESTFLTITSDNFQNQVVKQSKIFSDAFNCKGVFLKIYGHKCYFYNTTISVSFVDINESKKTYNDYIFNSNNQNIILPQLPSLNTTKNITKIDVLTKPKPATFNIE